MTVPVPSQLTASSPVLLDTLGASSQSEQARPQPRRVLVVCDQSGMGLGGVPVLNLELTKGLVASGHDVTVLLSDDRPAYDQQATQQAHHTDQVYNLFPPGPPDRLPEGRDRLVALAVEGVRITGHDSPVSLREILGRKDFDVIIGHSRFSGPAAQKIREKHYKEAKVAHLLHTSPVRLEVAKSNPDAYEGDRVKGGKKATVERELMRGTDLVVGVGGLLTEEADRLSGYFIQSPALHTLIPGVPIPAQVPPREPFDPEAKEDFRLLLSGRATDAIKGVEPMVAVMQALTESGQRVHLRIRGASEQSTQTITSGLHSNLITREPFSTNPQDLQNDRSWCHAVVMPSLHEGFGLVATEAVAEAIPVLVNADSGAARFFTALNHPNFVAADGRQSWHDAIVRLLNTYPAACSEAATLQGELHQYAWRHAAQGLVEAAVQIRPNGSNPFRPTSGPFTVQGGHGQVIDQPSRGVRPLPAYFDGNPPWRPDVAQ